MYICWGERDYKSLHTVVSIFPDFEFPGNGNPQNGQFPGISREIPVLLDPLSREFGKMAKKSGNSREIPVPGIPADTTIIVFIEPFNISYQGNTRRQTQPVIVFVYFLQEPMYNTDGFASMRCPEMGILKGSTNTIIVLQADRPISSLPGPDRTRTVADCRKTSVKLVVFYIKGRLGFEVNTTKVMDNN